MTTFQKIKQLLAPYWDVILFMVCLVVAHFFWKFTVDADEQGGPVFWFGLNITAPFDFLSAHICRVLHWLVSLTRDTLVYYPPDGLRYSSTGHGEKIVWSCTALKQAFIWLVIMLFARGKWYKKLWFIPFGWLCIYVFNILRLYIITLVIEHHNELFTLLHDYVLKYLFYFMLFMLWVWWTEKIGKTKTASNTTNDKKPQQL